ncbi:MAG: glycoside hydrolase [Chloroflexi bacterium]|nr:glycoside hydrolase [Chloroflexota bacterium]
MKIALIGGGGARTPAAVYAIARRHYEVAIEELVLYDINLERQRLMADIAFRILQQVGYPFRVKVATHPAEAIDGASFVITTLRVGGEAARAQDERIALQYGCIGQETTGPAGFSFALRTVPVLVEYAELIGRLAPDAWLINFTNPAGLVAQGLHGCAPVRVVGVCDSPHSLAQAIARATGFPGQELRWHYTGLNHLGWITSVRQVDRELLPALLADEAALNRLLEDDLIPAELVRHLGLIPNEYLYYYYFQQRALAQQQRAGQTRGEFLQQLDDELSARLNQLESQDVEGQIAAFAWYLQRREETYLATERTRLRQRPMLSPLETILASGQGYMGIALDFIASLRSPDPHPIVLNVPNQGLIPWLADDDVIETTCEVSSAGLRPLPGPELPLECRALVQTVKAYERLTVEAALSGSRREAIRALTHHPLVGSYERAAQLVAAYVEAHRAYLPRFH